MMVLALYIIGAIVFIISMITGFFTGSFMGFFLALVGGISSAIIFFALAKIIDNQENILYHLQYESKVKTTFLRQEQKRCPKCNYEYDIDRISCPHCGYRG